MKLLFDFLPLLLFFVTFKYGDSHKDWAAAFASQHFGFLVAGGKVGPDEAGVLLATIVVMVATLLQALVIKLRGQKIDLMLWISLGLVVVLGGATIYFHDDTFIKWKTTALHWASALVFWGSEALLGRNLIKVMLDKEVQLPASAWRALNYSWVIFFVAVGAINLYVAYHYSLSTWADFKLFGETGLIVLFTLGQGVYMSRVMETEEQKARPAEGTHEH